MKKDLSIQLTEKLFHLIDYRLSRTDTNHLLEVIPHLQYVLDPRAYGTIVSQWKEVDYRQQKLGEVLWEFRNIMKLRQEILTTIIN